MKLILISNLISIASTIYGMALNQTPIISNSLYTLFWLISFLFVQRKIKGLKQATVNCITVFIMLSVFLGRTWNFYALVPHWDKLLHLISGILCAQIGKELYIKLNGNTKNKALENSFALFVSLSAASLWEIWEFGCDKILKMNAQNNSLNDTMLDIICGSVGALFKVIFDIIK